MGIRDTLKKNLDPEQFVASMERIKVSVTTTLNPNHRHDEEHEKEADRKRTEICESHRFKSFANIRGGNTAKWYSDGHDYFWALSELLEKAEETIFILDWWLTPELYLRRPAHLFEEFRLDRILKRKAEAGVQIRVIVYKEVTQALTLSSAHTKHHLEDLHDNIRVFRHPDHLGGETQQFYSHHEKLVVVDNEVACIGGLDICFGRWDTQSHPLSDCHPFELLERTLFVGQDYNNARVMDFQQVDNWISNQQSSLTTGRMPWHDVHTMFRGPSALDAAQHFIERWNFIKMFKYKNDRHYALIAFPHGADPLDDIKPENAPIAAHPNTAHFHSLGQHFRHPWHNQHRDLQVSDPDFSGAGNTDIQVIRSSADWSSGILTEHSIQNAYIQLIREATNFIYIENQFFVTRADDDNKRVNNIIGAAIAQRIIQAARDGRRFKVVVVIPTIPCFAGELQDAASIRTIMEYQYRSINRGKSSIFAQVEAAGVNPHDYISFYNLRGVDRIPIGAVREAEQASGVTYHQAQVAAARIYLGDEAYAGGRRTVGIKVPTSEPDAPVGKDGKRTVKVVEEVEMPATTGEAQAIIQRFVNGAPETARTMKDSIASCFLHGQPDIKQEPFHGTEEEEKNAYVTEETYIHSKLLIVDDRKVLIGSANLNDRSQCGNRDSEIAMVVEDKDMFETTMDGQKYMASKFAASFRRHLYRQHLGFISPQECTPETAKTYPTEAMRPAPASFPDPEHMEREEEWERIVADPLSVELENLWNSQAKTNTEVTDDLFQPVPSNRVRNWKQYDEYFVARGSKTGHIARPEEKSIDYIRDRLSQFKGCLIEMPLDFMADDDFERKEFSTNNALLDLYT